MRSHSPQKQSKCRSNKNRYLAFIRTAGGDDIWTVLGEGWRYTDRGSRTSLLTPFFALQMQPASALELPVAHYCVLPCLHPGLMYFCIVRKIQNNVFFIQKYKQLFLTVVHHSCEPHSHLDIRIVGYSNTYELFEEIFSYSNSSSR